MFPHPCVPLAARCRPQWSSKTWDKCGVRCEFVTENPVDATFGAPGDDPSVPQVMRSMEAMSYYPGNNPEKAREHYGVSMRDQGA